MAILLIAAALQQRFVRVPLDECAEGAAVQVMQKYSVPTSAGHLVALRMLRGSFEKGTRR
jgi:hypothetical protein